MSQVRPVLQVSKTSEWTVFSYCFLPSRKNCRQIRQPCSVVERWYTQNLPSKKGLYRGAVQHVPCTWTTRRNQRKCAGTIIDFNAWFLGTFEEFSGGTLNLVVWFLGAAWWHRNSEWKHCWYRRSSGSVFRVPPLYSETRRRAKTSRTHSLLSSTTLLHRICIGNISPPLIVNLKRWMLLGLCSTWKTQRSDSRAGYEAHNLIKVNQG